MKTYLLLLILLFNCLFSCTNEDKNKTLNTATQTDTLTSVQVTIIAELPDSLKPKTILLDTMPKPLRIAVPKKAVGFYSYTTPQGQVEKRNLEPPAYKLLPVLQNEKGETILDQEGKPFMMGDGGKSDFTNFTTDNGLALDAIMCSFIDKFGNLWFGTDGGGVSRYDGKSFTNFTNAHGLVNSTVYCINEDKAGNIWFGTRNGGVSRYNGKSFTNFNTAQGLALNKILCISEDRLGNLWFGSGGGGVSRFDGKSFTNFTTNQGLVDNDVRCITADKAGNLWFGSSSGVSHYNGKFFTNFSTDSPLSSQNVMSIIEDKEGNIWFSTGGNGVIRFDGKSFTNFTTNQGLVDNDVWCIKADKVGNIWFGCRNGVSRYNGKSFASFTTLQGLSFNFVRCIVEDKEGNIWFGTDGNGVSRYNGKSFTNFSTDLGLRHNIIDNITEDKLGNLWFSTYGGISHYDRKSFTNFSTAQGLAKNFILCSIEEDNAGNLWFGTHGGGVSRYDGKSFTSFTTAQGLINNVVRSMVKDNIGNLWFGTFHGISRYDGKSFTNFSTDQGFVKHNEVTCITKDKVGNLWFGTDAGVSRYDGQSFINFSTTQGLANNVISSIIQDINGNLWFGTSDGLSVINTQNLIKLSNKRDRVMNPISSDTLFKTFTTKDGLPDNFISQIVQLPNGKMAVGTNLGITVFNPSENFTKLSEIEIYNTFTGYPVKDVNAGQNGMFLDSKGIIWAGTGSEKTSLVKFDYAAVQKNKQPPVLVIQSVKVNEENISWYDFIEQSKVKDSISIAPNITEELLTFGRELTEAERKKMLTKYKNVTFDSIGRFYPIPQHLVLPYEHNNISIEFNAIETSKPQLVNYQYMLDGYDKEWSPVLKKTSATFGNINEGTYTFRVKAQAPNGVWCQPITYTFSILPPWYRTWWAYTIYLLLLMPVGRVIYKFQKARIMKMEREKAKDRELAHAKEIEKAYDELGMAHEKLKSTQNQLIQSEKLASLGELTAGIAHEIQNPLNFVTNFSELSIDLIKELQEERQKTEEERDIDLENELLIDLANNQDKINHHGKRASSIVKGMLEHSKPSSGKKEPTDINALCDEYLRLSYHGLRARDKNFQANYKTDLAKDLPKVEVLSQELGRVLSNLINNAFYAVNKKYGTEEDGMVIVSTRKMKNTVAISVKDNGTGMSEAIKSKIFQPFFTTKPTGEGTGLGLSLAYDIITKGFGGSLKVETKEGEGTEMIIILPIE